MKEIKKIFADELSNCGFSRKKDWYYRNDDLIIVVNIQQSNYDKTYFLNVGVWITAINNEIEFPKENKCHLRFRAERLLPNVLNDSSLRGIFSFEKEDKYRLKTIQHFIRDHFCPLLK